MTGLSFTVPGEVRGWARARLGKTAAGRPMHFTDGKTAAYERSWAMEAHLAMKGSAPMEGPLLVNIVARFVPPQSTSAKRCAAMLAGEIRPTKKPDLDNIIKNLDGLNGVAFKDDAQITQIVACKVYAHSAGVDITIQPAFGPVALKVAA